MLNAKPFRDSILLGANVEDSLVHDWLKRFHHCRFVEHEPIKAGLREFPSDIGSRLFHTACSHEVLYQCVMRTALRDPNSRQIVHTIVPDEPSARRLAGLIGTSEVNQLGSLYAAPRTPLTPTQKSRNNVAKKSREALFVPKSQLNSYIKDFGMDSGTFLDDNQSRFAGPLAALADQPNFDLDGDDGALDETPGGNGPTCFVTFHKEPQAYKADEFLVRQFRTEDFVAFLRQQARAIVKKKSDKLSFNPCLFEPPDGADGYRRTDYFKQSSFLVLDFDDGELSPKKFASIFWDDAGRGRKLSFVICNSYSRCPEAPNKFRVVMFYKQAATSLEQHKAVYAAIVARLEEHGFTAEAAKLDPQCKSGVQSFYLPCTNEDHPKWAFFTARGTKTQELERCAIDPVAV
jgi:hypothetical protein